MPSFESCLGDCVGVLWKDDYYPFHFDDFTERMRWELWIVVLQVTAQ